MGHLINIANNIVIQCEKNNALDTFVKTNLSTECLNKWENLVNTKLVEINKTREIFLVTTLPLSYQNVRPKKNCLLYYYI